MKNAEKSEIFDEKWGFSRIYLTGRGFRLKMIGDRGGESRVVEDFIGFRRFPGFMSLWGFLGFKGF